uniref:Tail fiber protein n=1 Tax=Ralstonia phage BOESR1 TaxID=3034917 RepID=A0AA49EP65_9CAUD|nr:hypothetical protein HIBIKMCM_00050 [Ralstonia phage BOESR1]
MAFSYTQLPGDGTTKNFAFTFGYLSRSHIGVKVNGAVTAFTWLTDFSIQIATAPAAGAVVEIRRTTPLDQQIVIWNDGATLTEADMNLDSRFNLYVNQESRDAVNDSVTKNSLGVWDGQSRKTTNFADPTDATGLVTRNYFESVYTPLLDSKVTTATTKATEAATSAATAQGYALAADSSADLAAALLATFKGQYLGASATAPTVDGNGQPLTAGDLYFDTTQNFMKVYTGSAWINAGSTIQATIKRPATPIIATAAQTSVPVPGGYDSPYISVFRNGVLVNSPDVNVTSGSNIVFSSALAAGDKVDYVAFGAFQVANPVIDGTSAADFIRTRNVRVVTSKAQLRALDKNTYTFVLVTGDTVSGDGGGGFFFQNTADTTTADNGGATIVAADGARWQYLPMDPWVPLKLFGAVSGVGVDNTAKIQAWLNYCVANGRTGLINAGEFEFTGALTVNLTSPPKRWFSIIGEGQSNSILRYTGATNQIALYIKGTLANFVELRGFRVERPDLIPMVGTGIKLDTHTNLRVQDVRTFRFNTGMSLIDVNTAIFDGVTWDYNNTGLYADGTGPVTHANLLLFTGCRINQNVNNGVYINTGHSNTFKGCSIEHNGKDNSGNPVAGASAIKVIATGTTGRNSTNVEGCYFEGNGGDYDFNGINTGGATYFFSGNTFNRISNTAYTTNNIYIDASSMSAGGAKTLLHLAGNGFATLGSYVDSSSRRCVVVATGPSTYDGYEVYDDSIYSAASAAPLYPVSKMRLDDKSTRPVAFGMFNNVGTVLTGYRVSSVVRNALGDFTINFFGSVGSGIPVLVGTTAGSYFRHTVTSWSGTAVRVTFFNTAGGAADPDNFLFHIFGV